MRDFNIFNYLYIHACVISIYFQILESDGHHSGGAGGGGSSSGGHVTCEHVNPFEEFARSRANLLASQKAGQKAVRWCTVYCVCMHVHL